MSPAWTAMTAAIKLIMESSSGRRPTRSMRAHGMNEARKNHVWRKPLINADMWSEKPIDDLKSVAE